jgi:hypothetical protein
LANKRRFRELLIRDRGGCTEHNPGIGDIESVKDLQMEKIVNGNFRCSLFGAHLSPSIGWVSSGSYCFSLIVVGVIVFKVL